MTRPLGWSPELVEKENTRPTHLGPSTSPVAERSSPLSRRRWPAMASIRSTRSRCGFSSYLDSELLACLRFGSPVVGARGVQTTTFDGPGALLGLVETSHLNASSNFVPTVGPFLSSRAAEQQKTTHKKTSSRPHQRIDSRLSAHGMILVVDLGHLDGGHGMTRY